MESRFWIIRQDSLSECNDMKILVINPNSDAGTDAILRQKASTLLGEDMMPDIIHLDKSPHLIGSRGDAIVASYELLQEIRRQEQSYDAFIIACHSDPALDAAREIFHKPVWGIGEASIRCAGFYGRRMGILIVNRRSYERKLDQVRQYGLESLLCGMEAPQEDSFAGLREAGERLIAQGADVIVLGCANYACYDRALEECLHVPVIDGFEYALYLARGFRNDISR